MKDVIEYNDRKIVIKPYAGNIERDLILYKFSRDEEHPPKLKDIWFILEDYVKSNIPFEQLTENEKIFILYSIRGMSVSDNIELNFNCPNCNDNFRINVEISKIIEKSELPKGYNNIYSENLEDYLTKDDLDSENFEDFDKKLEEIEKHKTKFIYIREIECVNCGAKSQMNLADLNILCSCFSNFDIVGFYNSLNSLVYYGKYSFSDLLNYILPFERELITSFIQSEMDKALEAQNKYSKKGL